MIFKGLTWFSCLALASQILLSWGCESHPNPCMTGLLPVELDAAAEMLGDHRESGWLRWPFRLPTSLKWHGWAQLSWLTYFGCDNHLQNSPVKTWLPFLSSGLRGEGCCTFWQIFSKGRGWSFWSLRHSSWCSIDLEELRYPCMFVFRLFLLNI